jgi:protein phosphatase
MRDNELKRLTRDHSVLEEMLVARPDMSAEEIAAFAHRNVVTKSLGSKEEVEPTLYVNTLAMGDKYLLCSDGLWTVVPDATIEAIIRDNDDIDAACQLLIDAANEAGGPDNISAVLVRVG